jgi:hypothetical protein
MTSVPLLRGAFYLDALFASAVLPRLASERSRRRNWELGYSRSKRLLWFSIVRKLEIPAEKCGQR